jgi:hypothetical protein
MNNRTRAARVTTGATNETSAAVQVVGEGGVFFRGRQVLKTGKRTMTKGITASNMLDDP